MANVFQLKISLKRSKPPIWRRVLVKDNLTFLDLHHTIQGAMGWFNCHLHEFDLGTVSVGIPSQWDDLMDSSKIRVKDYAGKVGAKLKYTYDFGDGWEHSITLEKILPMEKGTTYPICIAGKKSCPPEDCGGVGGYNNLIKILKNKKHPEYEEMVEWVGDNFDPEAFSVDQSNEHLKLD